MRLLLILTLLFVPCLAKASCYLNAGGSTYQVVNPNQVPAQWFFNSYLSTNGNPVLTPGTADQNCAEYVDIAGGSGGSSSLPLYVQIVPKVVTETPVAYAITTGGTPQIALASSTSRLGCQIENTSTGTENIDVTSTPVTVIQPGGTYTCNVAANQVSQQTIYILGATTGQGFVVTSW